MKHHYRNIAPTRVLGYAPGETFHAQLDPAHEQRLLVGGHIEYVPEVSDGPTEDQPCDPGICGGDCPECEPMTRERVAELVEKHKPVLDKLAEDD